MQDDFVQAIKSGQLDKVRNLLRDDPDLLMIRDSSGVSMVLLAVYYGQEEIAREILRHGVSLDTFEASALGEIDRLLSLIKTDRSLVNNYSKDGFTPLGLAAFFGRHGCLKLLIDNGADVNAVSKNQMHVRPIHSAVAHRQPQVALKMAECLLKNGAEVNVAQQGGWTPLHQAAKQGQIEIVRLLLSYGASVPARSEDGRTAADLALEAGFSEVASILSMD